METTSSRHAAPPLSPSLAARLDAASIAMNLAGARAVAAIPGNPRGLDVRVFGEVTAVRSRVFPDYEWDNRTWGLTEDRLDRLPQILAFYEQHGARPSIDINQCHLTEGLGRALHEAGFFPRDVYPIHYGAVVPGEPPPPPDGVEIRISPDAEIETWVRMFLEGFGLVHGRTEELLVRRTAWFLAPGFRRYIATLKGEPSAVAGLFLHSETAILDPATTLPRARGRGLQQALIRHRLAVAAEAGCDLAGVETGWATISHRNQQRVGFDVAFNRIVFSPAYSERA
ncbi:MAG TPA: hypothetical protein VFJ13_06030 [Paracoccaceae bacterium]|nr:hypothetical protein [Paracoccaceae bacterium]